MDDTASSDGNLGFNVTNALSNSKSGLLSLLKNYEYKPLAFIPGLAESPKEKPHRMNSSQSNDNSRSLLLKHPEDLLNLPNPNILQKYSNNPNTIIHIKRSNSDSNIPDDNDIDNGAIDTSTLSQDKKLNNKSIFISPNPSHKFENNHGIKESNTFLSYTKSDYGKLATFRKEQQSKESFVLPSVSSPLPLMNFSSLKTKQDITAKTINRQEVRSIPNLLTPSSVQSNEKLCDPIISRKISKWFSARSFKEYNWKQNELYGNSYEVTTQSSENPNSLQQKMNISYIEVYESYLYLESNESKLERDEERNLISEDTLFHEHWIKDNSTLNTINNSNIPPFIDESSCDYMSYTTSLKFDGEFESGNLEKSTRILGRESIMNPKALEVLQDYIVPKNVDQEYDLILRKDLNTNGNIQWYYFSVTSPSTSSSSVRIKYPLRVRFNITNMQKNDSLYNYGMKPAIYSENQINNEDWIHSGEDVCYYRNGLTNIKNRGKKKLSVKNQYTLTFTYTFTQPDTVYFAHTFPYTYSDLQTYLNNMENCPRTSSFFHRRTLSSTLAGNLCDIITITERSKDILESKQKPSIILTSRVHPGESNSSFMMQGFLDFITSDDVEAIKLRKAFVFSIVPMLNPDGVVHGNYRSSLAGTDLNRRFLNPHPILHPTITALKNFLRSIHQKRCIYLYLDLHGHSKLKNSFLYGCDFTLQQDKITKHVISQLNPTEIHSRKIFARVFPKILCEISNSNKEGYFSYRDSSFTMDKSKNGTGRIVGWNEISIPASYTIEASFCGNGDNSETKLFKKASNTVNDKNINNSKQSHSNGIAYSQQTSKKMKGSKPKSKTKSNSGNELAGEEVDEISNAINSLLDKYKNYVHYRKVDLLNMGRDIGRAIYHFGNLSYYKENESTAADSDINMNKGRRSSLLARLHQSNKSKDLSIVDEKPAIETTINTNDDEISYANVEDDDVLSNEEESDSDSTNDQASTIKSAHDVPIDAHEIAEKIKNIRRSEVHYFDSDMLNEFISKPGVYSTNSMEELLNKYPSEFQNITISSSRNVSMRMKCEYHIRRGLQLDRDIKIEKDIDLSNIEISEENLSVNGSESDPSQDNAPTSKMLKNMGKYKNTTNLVSALRKIIFQKKKNEEIKLLKIKVQNARLVAKQLSDARKASEDADYITAKEISDRNKTAINDALDKQNQLNNEKFRRNSVYAFGSSATIDKGTNKEKFEKVYSYRKSSIFDSTPKRLPIVKHEIDEINKDMKTIQLKIVNFHENIHINNKPKPNDNIIYPQKPLENVVYQQRPINTINESKKEIHTIIKENPIVISTSNELNTSTSNKYSLLNSVGLFTLPDIDLNNNNRNNLLNSNNYYTSNNIPMIDDLQTDSNINIGNSNKNNHYKVQTNLTNKILNSPRTRISTAPSNSPRPNYNIISNPITSISSIQQVHEHYDVRLKQKNKLEHDNNIDEQILLQDHMKVYTRSNRNDSYEIVNHQKSSIIRPQSGSILNKNRNTSV